MTHTSASKWVISSGVLKWYGSQMVAVFRLVGSKQILSLSCQAFLCLLPAQSCLSKVWLVVNTCLQHLVNLLFKWFLEMYWYWSTWSLLRSNAWINMCVVRSTRKTSHSNKYIRISLKDLFLACDELGHCNQSNGCCTCLLGDMYSQLAFNLF